MIKIQKQAGDCVEIVLAMDKICFPGEETPWTKDRIWWLAKLDGDVVGYAALKPLRWERGACYLSRAGVLPKARRQGIHRRLLRARLTYARIEGLNTVITYTSDDNLASMNSLVSAGFRFYEPEWAWAGRDMHYFMLEL